MIKNKKYIKITLISLISMILIFSFCKNIFSVNNNKPNEIIKVGFYKYDPYYFLDDESNYAGYYHDLMKLISSKLDTKFEYINLTIAECMDALVNGKIDLLFGVSKSTDRLNYLSFSKSPIASEPMSLYTSKDLDYGDLNSINGLKLGFISKESNHDWLFNLLNDRNINVKTVEAKSYEELEQLLIDEKVDIIPQLSVSNTLSSYKNIFDFSIGKIYLATSKSNQVLIDKINTLLTTSNPDNILDESNRLYSTYFSSIGDSDSIRSRQIEIIVTMSLCLCILLFLILRRPFRKKLLRKSIQNHINNNDFVLHFQPIVDPKSQSVKGFEGLIRLNKNGSILSPFLFLDKIETSNMMHKVSKWLIKDAIKNFHIIKNFECVKDSNFYISLNLSFKEI